MTKKRKKKVHSTTEDNDRKLYNKIAYLYMQKDVIPSSAIARRFQVISALKKLIKEKQSLGRIIDIGCGVGAPAKYLYGLYDSYLGIDHSGEEIQLARQFNKGNLHAKFIAQTIKKVSVSNKADTILSIGALHHMTNLKEVICIINKLGKPKSTLVLIEPQKSNRIIQYLRNKRKIIDTTYSKKQRYFKATELINLLSRHGYEDISVDYQGFLSPIFAQVVLRPQIIIVPLSKLAIWIDSLINLFPSKVKRLLSFNIIINAKSTK